MITLPSTGYGGEFPPAALKGWKIELLGSVTTETA